MIHILSLSNSHNNVASIQKNRGDKSHRVIVALHNDALKEPRVVFHKAVDERKVVYDGRFTEEQIIKFLQSERYELVAKYSRDNPTAFQGEQELFLVVFLNESIVDIKQILPSLTETAKSFKGRLRVVYADIAKIEENDHELQRLLGTTKVEMADLPLAVRIFNKNNQQYIYKYESKAVSEKELHDFVLDYFDGKIKPYFRSEEVPEDWNKYPVKVLVGKNFGKVAYDKSKNVLVAFHA